MTGRDDDGNGWDDRWYDTTAVSSQAVPSRYGGPWAEPTEPLAGRGTAQRRGGAGLLLVGLAAGSLIVALVAVISYLVLDRDKWTDVGSGVAGAGNVGSGEVGQGDEGSTLTTPAPEVEAAPESGIYSGVLSQRGTRGGRADQDYTVIMTFSSTGSTVDYPGLGCSGTLAPQGDADGVRVYRETLTTGRCDPTGTWYITRGSDTAISAEYRSIRSDYVVVGQLTR